MRETHVAQKRQLFVKVHGRDYHLCRTEGPMRKLQALSFVLLTIFSGVAVPAMAAKKKAAIKVINNSKWEIPHLYLSSTTDKNWRPDESVANVRGTASAYSTTDIDR